jgi:hypothetical protein
MSFVVIGEKDFNRLLIKLHLDFLLGEKMGLLVKFLRNCIRPNGFTLHSLPRIHRGREGEAARSCQGTAETITACSAKADSGRGTE